MKYLYFILTFFLFFSCQGNKVREIEPNSSRWDAQLLRVPVILEGNLKDQKDEDFFKFIVEKTNIGDIEVKTSPANSLVVSFSYQNDLLKKVYLNEAMLKQDKKEIILKNILFKKGIYYLSLEMNKGRTGSMDYELAVKLNEKEENLEKEPNDRLVEANYINSTNGMVKGHFSPYSNFALPGEGNQEADWFVFNSQQKSNILSIEITSVPDIDPVIELYNPMGYLLKQVDSESIEEPEVLKNFGILEQGDYYIKVYNKNPGTENNEVPYQLYVNTTKRNLDFEFEPNDSMNSANPLNGPIKGYINPQGDVDYFFFNVVQDRAICHISITPVNKMDFKLDVLNQFGERCYTVNSGQRNEGEIIPNLMLKKGKYFIAVSDSSNRNQNYLDPYVLKVEQKEFNPQMEYEPDDSFEQAIPLTLNQSLNGFIAPKGDQDVFMLTLDKDKEIKMEISPVPELDLVILVYDASKNLLQEIKSRGKGEGGSTLVSLPAGTYYIILKDAENNSNSYESYMFSVFER